MHSNNHHSLPLSVFLHHLQNLNTQTRRRSPPDVSEIPSRSNLKSLGASGAREGVAPLPTGISTNPSINESSDLLIPVSGSAAVPGRSGVVRGTESEDLTASGVAGRGIDVAVRTGSKLEPTGFPGGGRRELDSAKSGCGVAALVLD